MEDKKENRPMVMALWSLMCFVDDYSMPSIQDETDMHEANVSKVSMGTFDSLQHGMPQNGNTTKHEHRAQIRTHNEYSRIIPDSGCSIHCFNDPRLFHKWTNTRPNIKVRVANGVSIPATAIGEVILELYTQQGQKHQILLQNCLYMPSFSSSLLSIRQLWKQNDIKTRFGERDHFKLRNGTKLYFDDQQRSETPIAYATTMGVPHDILHRRYGHIGYKRLQLAIDRCNGIPNITGTQRHLPCEPCEIAGKQRKRPVPYRPRSPRWPTDRCERKTQRFGELVHSDLCGPLPESVCRKYTYAICFVDDYTSYTGIAFLKTKSPGEVLSALQAFEKSVRRYLPRDHIEEWHTDNGGEFTSNNTRDFCEEIAIKRSYSVPYTSNTNAKAERFWGLVLRPMRAMFADTKVDDSFWPYAMDQACQLHNTLPTSTLVGDISPHEALTGNRPDMSQFRVWGCTCYYKLHKRELHGRSKFHPRSVPAIYLGKDPVRQGYKVYIPTFHRITTVPWQARFNERGRIEIPKHTIRKIHETFDDNASGDAEDMRQRIPPAPPSTTLPRPPAADVRRPALDRGERTGDQNTDAERDSRQYKSGDRFEYEPGVCGTPGCQFDHGHDGPHSNEIPISDSGGLISSRLRRRGQAQSVTALVGDALYYNSVRICPNYGENAHFAFPTVAPEVETPNDFGQAIKCKQSDHWWRSMQDEISGLLHLRTWDLVPRKSIPPGRRPLKSRWVYKIKMGPQGTIERWKSRFVVKGYSQIPGVDFDRAFSSTMRATSFRILLALAAIGGFKLESLDVSNAFCQAEIRNRDVWVEQAPGFEQFDENGEPMVYKLRKALYGLHESGREWQTTLREYLLSPAMGFTQSTFDPCLFVRRSSRGIIILGTYVDDLVCAHNDAEMFKEFIDTFKSHFISKYAGKLTWFLGMSIHQNSEGVWFNQEQYIKDLVKKFIGDSSDTIQRTTPSLPENFKAVRAAADDAERMEMRNKPYLEIVGSLLYLSTMSRPDISYHLSVLSRYMADPSPICFREAQSVLKYLYKTRDLGIQYTRDHRVPEALQSAAREIRENMGFHAYSDSSWGAPNPAYGFVVILGGGPISWVSKKCANASSSCEAEYTASSKVARDVHFIRSVLHDLGFTVRGRLAIGCDNSSSITLAHNMGVTPNSKHYERETHYIRSCVDRLRVLLLHIPTEHNRADIFTKALGKTVFQEHCRRLLRSKC